MLALELSALVVDDFDIGLLGFDPVELTQIIGNEDPAFDDESDDVESPARKYAVQIDAKDENEQLVIIEIMQKDGYKCRALIF
jgi:hypothetical protein